MRALAHSHTRSFDAAAIARRPARRQPGKLQARPYFVLSCCFSTRRKEMSEQTRHATPNLLISIHILWLLISSLLHSLSTRLPPLAALRFTSLTTTVFSISLSFFIFYPLPFSFSAILFSASPQFASYPSSRLLFSFFLPASAPASSFLYTFLPLFSIYLLIFSLNSISCRRKNPRDFFSLAFLPLSKSSRDTSCRSQRHPVRRKPPSLSSVSLFVSFRVPPSRNFILSDDSPLTVGTVSGVVSHNKSLNNFNVASSFLPFFFSEFNRPPFS